VPKTILHVEDRRIEALITAAALAKFGYQVLHVDSGIAALELCDSGVEFDLVLMDLNLNSEPNGAETARRLLLMRSVPIVFLSARIDLEFVEQLDQIPHSGFTTKPFNELVLMQVLKAAFRSFTAQKEKNRLLAELEQKNKQFELVADNINDGIVHLNSLFELDYASRSYLTQTGYGAGKNCHANLDEMLAKVHPEDREYLLGTVTDALKDGAKSVTVEYRFLHANGEYYFREDSFRFSYDEEGTFQEAYLTCRDVSERKKIEAKVLEESIRLKLIMEVARLAWWEIDFESGKIVFSTNASVNGAFEPRQFNHYNEFTELIHPDDLPMLNQAVQDYLSGSQSEFDLEFRFNTTGKDYRWVRSVCEKRLSSDASRAPILTGVVIEVNERKQAELVALESSRLRTIGEVATSVAHDFNNSLQAISSFVDLALLVDSLPAGVPRYLTAAKTLAYDASQRIKPLQRLAEGMPTNLEMRPLVLHQLLEEVAEQSRTLWDFHERQKERSIELVFNLLTEATIDGNPGALRSAFYNLVKNAVEAMKQGGRLTIEVGTHGVHPYVRISDTGSGMDEATRLKMFQPFFSTKGLDSGRGLGLSAVRAVFDSHQASIKVLETAVNQGTVIEVVFQEGTLPPVELPPQEKVSGLRAMRVLWVDDEEMIASSGKEMLELLGHQATYALSGGEALQVLDKQNFDLVITDLGMPGMDGWQFAEEVRLRHPRLLISVLTGWGDSFGESEKDRRKVFDILVKPLPVEKLRDLMARVSTLETA